MGRVVVSQFITLDGVVEDPGGSEDLERGGWAFDFDRGPDGDKFKLDELMASDALLLGRVTCEGGGGHEERRVRRQVQRDAQVRRLDDDGQRRLEQLDAHQGRRGGRSREAEGGAVRDASAATAFRLAETKPAGETLVLVYEPAVT